MRQLFVVVTVVILQVTAQKSCDSGDVCRDCSELVKRFGDGEISLRILREKSCGESLNDRKFCCPAPANEAPTKTCSNGEVCTECPGLIRDFGDGRISRPQLFSKRCGKRMFCCKSSTRVAPAPAPASAPASAPETSPDAPSFIPGFEDNCGSHVDLSNIVGGEDTKAGRYPFMVLIGAKSTEKGGRTVKEYTDQRCGATIVNKWYVLTAAHCYPYPDSIDKEKEVITIGEYELGSVRDCQGNENCLDDLQIRKPQNIIIHQDYKRTSRRGVLNDIALVKVDTMIDFKKFVRPVCLPLGTSEEFDFLGIRNYDEDIVGIKGHVIGWGYTSSPLGRNKTNMENTQQKVNLPVIDSEQCAQEYNTLKKTVSFDDKFCAGEDGKDSCNGDSGGPMVINKFSKQTKELLTNNDESHWIQVGIVSFGPALCGQSIPGVYTRVSKHIEWIKENLK